MSADVNEVGTPEGVAAITTMLPQSTSSEPTTLVTVTSSRNSQWPRNRLVTSSAPTKMEPRMVKGPRLKPTIFKTDAMPYMISPTNHACQRPMRTQRSGTLPSLPSGFG